MGGLTNIMVISDGFRWILMKMMVFLYLEFADLSVKGEGVKEHRADEGDVRRLAA